jgi:hypothetical protein
MESTHETDNQGSGAEGLRKRAREAIQGGKLPACAPDRLWAGPAAGVPCAICGVALQPAEAGYEIEFGGSGGRVTHIVHIRCYAAVEEVRRMGAP